MQAAEAVDNLDDAEVVCDGRACYVGLRPVARATVNQLLRLVLLREDGAGGGMERYTLNEESRALLKDPGYVPQILKLTGSRKPHG